MKNGFELVTLAHGSYEVKGWLGKYPQGQRIRKRFKDQTLAVTFKQNCERQALNLEPLPAVTTRLTDEQAREAESCFHRLTGSPLTMSRAVEFALANWRETAQAKALGDALAKFLAEKKQANKRERTIGNLNTRLGRMAKTFGAKFEDEQWSGGKLVGDIQPDALRPLIFRDGSSLMNRRNDILALTNFFGWCVRQHYCAASPMSRVERVTLDQSEPEVVSLEDCRKLLRAAEGYKAGVTVPYFALAMFCGLRPGELERLTWADVDLAAFTVTVGSKAAKKRGRRVVEMPAICESWLDSVRLKVPALIGSNHRQDFDAVRKLAGFGTGRDQKPWVQDGLRHTAISYRLAITQDDSKTALWAGNSADVIHTHYKGLVTAKQTAEFYALAFPGAVVVELAANG